MKQFLLFLSMGMFAFHLSAQDYTPKYQVINKAAYPTSDLAIATYNVADYGADATGNTDCTQLFQTLLDKLGGVGTFSNERGNYANKAGGILYIPEGKYLLTGQLYIPRGVTMRGDWVKPDANGQRGTILLIKGNAGTDDQEKAAIIMQPATEVSNLSFYYPDQNVDNVQAYPPTIMFGQTGYWGNEYTNARHLTFINSYRAIWFNAVNGGGCPNIFDVYGSPLHEGIVIDNLADVGRFDGIHFSGSYWANSGMDGAPNANTVNTYLKNNATGFIMRRNDWSYLCNFDCDNYKVGFSEEQQPNGGSKPNGHNYNLNFTNCGTGIAINAMSYCGCLFAKVNTTNCNVGVDLIGGGDGPAQFYGCNIRGNQHAIVSTSDWGTACQLQDCSVSGPVYIKGGQLIADNNTFNGNVTIASAARTIFTGNAFTTGELDNKSLFVCKVSDKASTTKSLPEFKDEWMEIQSTRPAKENLYVVTNYGATGLGITESLDNAQDNTTAIQNALNDAGNNGGGVVYLPSGHYRVNGNLTIPSGVELKGSSDVATVPKGNGAVLEVYAGAGNENADPFITMQPNSGLRGITVNYPNQKNPKNVTPYPYTVRGNKNCYIVNLAVRAAYKAVDLFTNDCSNHYVDYLSGHAFKNVIRVGGNSKGGIISNIQCNTIAYACGSETKFGAWPNSGDENTTSFNGDCYTQNAQQLDFMIIDNCDDEVLYNNFLYGCNKGMVFGNDDGVTGATNVHSLGNAVDGAVKTFVFNKLGDDLDLVNSQVVALNNGDLAAHFITTGSQLNHAVNFLNSDHWGGGSYFATVKGGTVNLYNLRCNQMGTTNTFDIAQNANVNMENGFIDGLVALAANSGQTEPRLTIQSTVLDPKNWNQNAMAAYANNLPHVFERDASATTNFLDRSAWKVSASNDENGTGNSLNAIDGNSDTRWDTGGSQVNGQWFMVNMGSQQTFNTIMFDASGSPSDGPAGYDIYVGNDPNNLTKVASGTNAGSLLTINLESTTAQYIKIVQTGAKSNYWSIHEVNVGNISDEESVSRSPYKTLVIPGKIEAEDFDNGGEGVAYHCTETQAIGNVSSSYRNDCIFLGNAGDADKSTFNVGWFGEGCYTLYTVNVESDGEYSLSYRAASGNNPDEGEKGGKFNLLLDDVMLAENIHVPYTQGWDNYEDFTNTGLKFNLKQGQHTLKFLSHGGVNLDWLNFTSVATGISLQKVSEQDPAFYTLGGQRVPKPTVPGIYVSKGRKVIVK